MSIRTSLEPRTAGLVGRQTRDEEKKCGTHPTIVVGLVLDPLVVVLLDDVHGTSARVSPLPFDSETGSVRSEGLRPTPRHQKAWGQRA